MLALKSNITIYKDDVKKYYFNKVANCVIQTSWENLTSTAEITLPNYFIKRNRVDNTVKKEIQRGQKIEIELGYNPYLKKCFTGYIKKISTNSPFTIYAEDCAWVYKQKAITKYDNVAGGKTKNVKNLLSELQTLLAYNITVNTLDANIGTWTVQNSTLIEVLDELKSKFGLLSFFRNDELFIGTPKFLTANYPTKYGANEYTFWFDGQYANIKNHNLTWNDESDIRQVLKGELIKPNNTRVTKYAYYLNGVPTIKTTQPEGNMITRFAYDLPEADFESFLLEELQLINYTGWHGEFTSFGDEIRSGLGGAIEHGDKVNLHSLKEPEKNGKYLVKAVTINFGNDGYERVITLDQKLTE